MKSIFASKTFWVNLTALITAAGAYAAGEADISTSVTAGVLAIMNIILRFMTKEPVSVAPGA